MCCCTGNAALPRHAIRYHRVPDSRAQPFTQETIGQGIDRTRPGHDGLHLGRLGMVGSSATPGATLFTFQIDRKGEASLRRIATLVAMSILATHAVAIERHDISQMSCEAVGRALRSEQRSILRYHSQHVDNLMLYDICVRDRQSCKPSEAAVPTRVPAADGPCRVFRCERVGRSFSRR